jgi:hypothetical protein
MASSRSHFTILRLLHAMAWFAFAAWLFNFGVRHESDNILPIAASATTLCIAIAALWGRAWVVIVVAPAIVILLVAITMWAVAGP